MTFFCFWQSSQPVSLFGDDKDVNWSSWSDVSECEDILVFVDHISWDLFSDEFVKNGLFSHIRYVYIIFSSNHLERMLSDFSYYF